MKRHVEALVRQALSEAIAAGRLRSPETPPFAVEVPSDPKFGDLSTNAALVLARSEGRPPRAVAEAVVPYLEAAAPRGWLAGPPEIAGPGFINFRLAPAFWQKMLADALSEGETYGHSEAGADRRVQVEFVSANPTGPLTVGHGRNAVIGDTLARLLAATGSAVEREYYFNNAGRQMTMLAESVRARYQELLGRSVEFPAEGYQGEYIRDIARELIETHGDGLDAGSLDPFRDAAERAIFATIRATQERLGIVFDRYFNETLSTVRGRSARRSRRSSSAGSSCGAKGRSGSRARQSASSRTVSSSRAPASLPIACPTSRTISTSSRAATIRSSMSSGPITSRSIGR